MSVNIKLVSCVGGPLDGYQSWAESEETTLTDLDKIHTPYWSSGWTVGNREIWTPNGQNPVRLRLDLHGLQ